MTAAGTNAEDERLRIFSETTRAFAEASLDYDRLLETIARRLAEVARGTCVLYIADDASRVLGCAASHAIDPDAREILAAFTAQSPMLLDQRSISQRVFSSGEAAILPRIDLDAYAAASSPPNVEFLRNVGAHSLLIVPLRHEGASLGVISLVRYRADAPAFDVRDRDLTQLIADQASLAIANSRLIVQRREAEAATRAEQLRFRALVENSAEGITLDTREATFDYVSPAAARILGREADSLTGEKLIDFVHEDDRAAVLDVMRRVRERPGATSTNLERFVRPDGAVRWVETTRTNRLDDAAVGGVVCNLRDVTESKLAADALNAAEKAKKLLETQLRQAQKMEAVGQLAGGIAHDFNNLLSVILTTAEIMKQEVAEDDPMRAELFEVQRAAERAAALTRQLLMFSRRQVVAPKVVDLNALIAHLDKMLQRLIGEDIDLVSLTDKPIAPVFVDPHGIEQVVMNLVVNARDAMPKGGKLTIETGLVVLDEDYASTHLGVKPGDYVLLAVSDTGVGIDKDTQARIFEPFFTTKEVGKGTGLGLSTVFGIVTQSGGSVAVYSEVGRGTTFKVYLPCMHAPAAVGTSRTPPKLSTGGETVLLVEDDDQVRAVARTILEKGGYKVLVAKSGDEAIAIADEHTTQIHLLLTDVVMPQMSGAELSVRLARVRPAMKVLCMSGYTDDSIVRHGVLVAEVEFVQKPITPALLLRRVREVLDGVSR